MVDDHRRRQRLRCTEWAERGQRGVSCVHEPFSQIVVQSTLVAADGDETTALLMYDSATRPVPNAPGADCVTVVDGRLTTLKIIFDSVPFAAARAALAVRSEWANDGLDAQRLAPRVTARFDFSTFPTLATDRLVLREFRVDDAGDLFAFRSDADEQKYNNEPLTHVDQAVAMIADLHAGYAAQTAIPWAVASRDDDRVIGLFDYVAWER